MYNTFTNKNCRCIFLLYKMLFYITLLFSKQINKYILYITIEKTFNILYNKSRLQGKLIFIGENYASYYGAYF